MAQVLAETAESLARTARELKGISPEAWLTFEEAAAYLKKTPKALGRVVARGEIPKHYLSERGILFSRIELDALDLWHRVGYPRCGLPDGILETGR